MEQTAREVQAKGLAHSLKVILEVLDSGATGGGNVMVVVESAVANLLEMDARFGEDVAASSLEYETSRMLDGRSADMADEVLEAVRNTPVLAVGTYAENGDAERVAFEGIEGNIPPRWAGCSLHTDSHTWAWEVRLGSLVLGYLGMVAGMGQDPSHQCMEANSAFRS